MKRLLIAVIITVAMWMMCLLFAPSAEAATPTKAQRAAGLRGTAAIATPAATPEPRMPARVQTTQSTKTKAISLGAIGVQRFPGLTDAEDATADWRIVNTSYFASVNLPFVKGRNFAPTETKEAPRVAIVDESLAQRLWPNQDAVGRRLRIEGDESPWMTVIGVVRHQSGGALESATHGQLYFPFPETTNSSDDNN